MQPTYHHCDATIAQCHQEDPGKFKFQTFSLKAQELEAFYLFSKKQVAIATQCLLTSQRG